jgi:hypothetical protein
MRRFTTPLVLASAVFVLAGGYLHRREWLDAYRDVPSEAPGAFVVRVGFPVNVGLSVLLAVALLATLFVARSLQPAAIAAAFLFQAGSLALLIGTRIGTVAGWTEPVWTTGASQTRAVEIAALVCLGAAATASRTHVRSTPVPTPA